MEYLVNPIISLEGQIPEVEAESVAHMAPDIDSGDPNWRVLLALAGLSYWNGI